MAASIADPRAFSEQAGVAPQRAHSLDPARSLSPQGVGFPCFHIFSEGRAGFARDAQNAFTLRSLETFARLAEGAK